MDADLLQGFYLKEILIEPLMGQVTVRSGTRHLAPKAMEVLVCLARAPGELVTRETLIEKVWGPSHGSQETLSHAVSDIRHALDDHADEPTFIQTLPKRGYRLVVAPELATDTGVILGTRGGDDLGLIANLKQRGVLETGLAYLVLGWLIIQVADIVFDQLHLPEWTGTFVTLLVIAGFPIALVLSWFLEFRDGRARLDDTSVIASRKRRFSRTYKAVIGALAAAAVLVSLYAQFYELPAATDSSPLVLEIPEAELSVADNTIAVLPFFNIDGSEDSQIFANGFVDDVINRLARVPGLLVSSRGDAFTLEPNSASQAVRRRLRVARYLEGSVQIDGERMRIIVQLIDSATGFHILSRTFDRPREDFFDIRDEVTNLTVASLRPALPPATRDEPLAPAAYPNLDAYVLYRHGVDELRKPTTPVTTASALGWFDKAIEIDSEYAAAYAGKCAAYVNSFHHTDDPVTVEVVDTACMSAIRLNPNLDIVHNALGDLYRLTGRYEESEVAYTRALRINSSNVESLSGLGEIYRLTGRTNEAEETLRKATGMRPGDWGPYNDLGFFFFRQGRYADAAKQFSEITALDPGNLRGYSNLGVALMMAGDLQGAARAYRTAIDIDPQPETYSNLGLMYYYLGQSEVAVQAMQAATMLAPEDQFTWSNLGDALWVSGQLEEAREAFSKALAAANIALGVNPDEPQVLMNMAWIYAMLDQHEAANNAIERASALLPDDPYIDFTLGLIQNRQGASDLAIASFENAVQKGYPIQLLAVEPHLARLRTDSRFSALVNRDRME